MNEFNLDIRQVARRHVDAGNLLDARTVSLPGTVYQLLPLILLFVAEGFSVQLILVDFQRRLWNKMTNRMLANWNMAWDHKESDIPRNENSQVQFILSLNRL